MYSRWYSEKLAFAENIDLMRAKANNYENYPSEAEVYETIAKRVEDFRRRWIIKAMSDDMAQAAADLANGSNSAQDRLIAIHNEIERRVKDRTDIGNQQYLTFHFDYDGQCPTYPAPPKENEQAA